MPSGSASHASPSNNLKRPCSSLGSDNTCSACGRTFGAVHLLNKHQRFYCRETVDEIEQLRAHAEELAKSSLEASKRRRVSGDSGSQGRGGEHNPSVPASNSNGSENHQGVLRASSTMSSSRSAGSGVAPLVGSLPHSSQDDRGPGTSQISNHDTTSSATQGVSASQPSNATSVSVVLDQGNATQDTFGAAAPENPPPHSVQESDTCSPFDSFRLHKNYGPRRSSAKDPDSTLLSTDLYDSRNHAEQGAAEDLEPSVHVEQDRPTIDETESYGPFPNRSSFELGDWFHGQGTQKSLKDFQALVKVLTDPSFSLDDIRGTKWTSVFQDLGKNKDDIHPARSQWVDDSGWNTTDIEIEVPIHNRMEKGEGVEKRCAGTLHHRSIVSILEEKIRNADASKFFHFDGHELMWKPDDSEGSQEFRVLSELYNSDAFLQAQRDVRTNPPPQIQDCPLERVVVGVMLWSDATHMSTFSTSKLWPLYMLLGNESKHHRGKDSADFCYHVAYFDTLSDSFKDYITERTGGKIPPNLAAHLNREFFHAQWVVILDDELLKAIVEGVVIECSDGVLRRFFIRIITYSADYPEKVLIATIKSRSDCPCVRCLVHKSDLHKMGTNEDFAFRKAHPRVDDQSRREEVARARSAIASGLAVGGDPVMRLLSHSGVPTTNAFSERLSSTGFNIFSKLVNDVLHEFEIGAFKALLLHLIRVLDASAAGHAFVHELDKRFRATPTFNQTIRRFSSNVSQLRRRAARDYEDILQCAIPAFHGFLPGPLGELVTKLLYTNARWHALAKLRMQTEATIILLEDATSQMGDQYRSFMEAVEEVETLETPAEAEKRLRVQKKKESQATAPKAASKSSRARAKAAKASESLPAKGSSKAATFRVVMPADPSTSTAENQIMSPVGNSTPTPIVPTSQTSGPPAPKIRRVKLIVRDPGSSTSRPTPATPSPLPPLPVPGQSSSTSTPPGSTSTLDVPTAGPIPPSSTAIGPSQLREGVSPCLPQEPVEGSSGSVNPPSGGQQAAEGFTQVEKSKKNWRRPKKMNISTIKFHALGHYPATIRFFGPSDLYSTEWGESFHKSPKAWFKSTSKRFVRKELSMHERKRARLKKAKQRILSKTKADHLAEQRSAARNPDIHHYIGKATHAPVYLLQFSQDGPLSRDIACLSFVRNLKKHLFRRFLCDMAPGLEAQDIEDLHEMYDWSKITFNHDRLYTHRIMRIKYTTYDARRNEDIIHLDTDQCNVMLLNPAYTYGGSHHPFLYGKVIAVLHADVGYIGDIGRRGTEYVYRRMELLWVRWYRVEPKEFTLDEAELLPIDAPDAHAFVDPSSVLRASHIVPKFSEGLRYTGGEGKSAIANDASDYKKYFVNRFVDRDMFMRYEWGLAVGHEYARSNAVEANNMILATRINVAGTAAPTSTSPSFVQPATCEAATLDSSIHALQTDVPTHDDDHDVSDDERHEVDEEDYVSDPDRDSEDDREEELFGDTGGGW